MRSTRHADSGDGRIRRLPFGDRPTALRIFDIALMLIGAALVAILCPADGPAGEPSNRGDLWFPAGGNDAQSLIIVGLGGVGIRVVEQLRTRQARSRHRQEPRHATWPRAGI